MKIKRWEIVHEDDDIVVINKPAPYLTIPDRYDQTKPNLVDMLSKTRDAVFVNHRIDKETSGLLVFSKNEMAHKEISRQFNDREVDKHYLTIVHGKPMEEVGLIDLKIGTSNSKRKGMIISDAGKECLTKYRILEAFRTFSLLEIKLLTGRQHQIRVHMQGIHCPVVCDAKYGDGEPFLLSNIKRKFNRDKNNEERPLLSRVALHSYILGFTHPTTHKKMEFKAELPKDMKAVVHQLRKWN